MKTRRLNFVVDSATARLLKTAAAVEGTTMSEIIRELLRDRLGKYRICSMRKIEPSSWAIVVSTSFAAVLQYLPVIDEWKTYISSASLFVLALGVVAWFLSTYFPASDELVRVVVSVMIALGASAIPFMWHQTDQLRTVTLEYLYQKDFDSPDTLQFSVGEFIPTRLGVQVAQTPMKAKALLDFVSNSKYLAVFIPSSATNDEVAAHVAAIVNSYPRIVEEVDKVSIQ